MSTLAYVGRALHSVGIHVVMPLPAETENSETRQLVVRSWMGAARDELQAGFAIPLWLKACLWLTVIMATGGTFLVMELGRARVQEQAVREVNRLGGAVYYAHSNQASDRLHPEARSIIPLWIRQRTAAHFLTYAEEALFSSSSIQDDDLRHLAGLSSLKKLTFVTGNITDAGLRHLEQLDSLTELTLSHTQVGSGGMQSLAKLHCLESLYLRRSQLGDEGLLHLAGLRSLEKLDIAGTEVTDNGIKHLARLRLNRLELQNTAVTDHSVLALASMQSLEYLNISGTQISDSGLTRLRLALPNAQIYR